MFLSSSLFIPIIHRYSHICPGWLISLKQGVVPIAVLDRRLVRKGSQAVPQVLIQWSDIPKEAATWEDYYVVKNRFPDAVAWGQADIEAGGVVTDSAIVAGGVAVQE
jgi:hypothetical protein